MAIVMQIDSVYDLLLLMIYTLVVALLPQAIFHFYSTRNQEAGNLPKTSASEKVPTASADNKDEDKKDTKLKTTESAVQTSQIACVKGECEMKNELEADRSVVGEDATTTVESSADYVPADREPSLSEGVERNQDEELCLEQEKDEIDASEGSTNEKPAAVIENAADSPPPAGSEPPTFHPHDEEHDEDQHSIGAEGETHQNDESYNQQANSTSTHTFVSNSKTHNTNMIFISVPATSDDDKTNSASAGASPVTNIYNYVSAETAHFKSIPGNTKINIRCSFTGTSEADRQMNDEEPPKPNKASENDEEDFPPQDENQPPPPYSAMDGAGIDGRWRAKSFANGNKNLNLRAKACKDGQKIRCSPIPHDVKELVTSVCRRADVSSARLYQSPGHCEELLVVGVNAENAEAALQEEMKRQFPGYTISAQSIKNPYQHTIKFAKKGGAFSTVREQQLQHNGKYVEIGKATCEFFLVGDKLGSPNVRKSYYALATAHLVLDDQKCEDLNAEGAPEATKEIIQKEVAGEILKQRFALLMLNPRKWITVLAHDIMYAYRMHQQDDHIFDPVSDHISDHYSTFINDSFLLEINKEDFEPGNSPTISFEELEDAMHTRKDGVKLGELWHLKDLNQLREMEDERVVVEVGPSTGYMVASGIALDLGETQSADRPQSEHIQIVVEDWALMKGHSGSIVYVIDAETDMRYPFGMLFGESRRSHHFHNNTIYQAVVLSKAIEELSEKYKNQVSNLSLLGFQEPTCQSSSIEQDATRLRQLGPEAGCKTKEASSCITLANPSMSEGDLGIETRDQMPLNASHHPTSNTDKSQVQRPTATSPPCFPANNHPVSVLQPELTDMYANQPESNISSLRNRTPTMHGSISSETPSSFRSADLQLLPSEQSTPSIEQDYSSNNQEVTLASESDLESENRHAETEKEECDEGTSPDDSGLGKSMRTASN